MGLLDFSEPQGPKLFYAPGQGLISMGTLWNGFLVLFLHNQELCRSAKQYELTVIFFPSVPVLFF